MDLEAMIWFVEVAQLGSFARAARRLKQPGSNVSRRIAKLEADLGFPLLLRTTRSLSLTQEGEAFLPLARELLEAQTQITDWRDSLDATPTGTLRVTAPGGFARGPLTDWLIRYRQKHPKVDVQLIHSNDYLDFQAHQLDFAFRQGPLPDSSLVAQRLFRIHYGVFVAPERRIEDTPLETPDQLTDRPIIASGAKGQALPWRFRDRTWTPKNPDILFEDIGQCLQAAAAGLGYTFTSRFEALPYLQSGTLEEVLVNDRPEPVGFYLVSPSRAHRSLKNESFVRHVLEEVASFGLADGLSI
ncbi:LysR family transcriptional regulator [Saccharospirillum salsuginis]|uniref:Transcriptional regulator n=1 Tax=Saccharospirillum salsuginis TaxID=418750 RepID=A0A918K3M8_9GAMM|nr:LysR family transcriptional regulator [Saccharospirillum salsuginis]GGX43748.1 transcriptional regulator [Saccharospirillum salsuginis]